MDRAGQPALISAGLRLDFINNTAVRQQTGPSVSTDGFPVTFISSLNWDRQMRRKTTGKQPVNPWSVFIIVILCHYYQPCACSESPFKTKLCILFVSFIYLNVCIEMWFDEHCYWFMYSLHIWFMISCLLIWERCYFLPKLHACLIPGCVFNQIH